PRGCMLTCTARKETCGMRITGTAAPAGTGRRFPLSGSGTNLSTPSFHRHEPGRENGRPATWLLSRLQRLPILRRPPHVRDEDRSADDQGDGACLIDLLLAHAEFMATSQVIADAVIAAQDHGGDEAEQFLGYLGKRAVLIGLVVQAEETLDDLVVVREDEVVHPLPVIVEVVDQAHAMS